MQVRRSLLVIVITERIVITIPVVAERADKARWGIFVLLIVVVAMIIRLWGQISGPFQHTRMLFFVLVDTEIILRLVVGYVSVLGSNLSLGFMIETTVHVVIILLRRS
jgi:hypothetical protein